MAHGSHGSLLWQTRHAPFIAFVLIGFFSSCSFLLRFSFIGLIYRCEAVGCWRRLPRSLGWCRRVINQTDCDGFERLNDDPLKNKALSERRADSSQMTPADMPPCCRGASKPEIERAVDKWCGFLFGHSPCWSSNFTLNFVSCANLVWLRHCGQVGRALGYQPDDRTLKLAPETPNDG